MDGIGTRPRLRASGATERSLIDQSYAAEQVADVPAALALAGDWLRDERKLALDRGRASRRAWRPGLRPAGPGRRRRCSRTSNAMFRWRRCTSRTIWRRSAPFWPASPDLPQVACFDTAFHRGHGALADHYAIPERFYAEGVRRYGFHGLSYEYIADRLPQVAPEIADGRVIVAHLGSGASMCALADGRSVESTMGFTALDGLPMGTRPGQIDPGVVLYLIREKRMSAAQVQHLLYHECGLKGLSGISNDVRELEASADPRARFALDYFVYRIGLYAGMLAAALGGLDAFVFTAGIGENSPVDARRIVERLAWLGGVLDPAANAAGGTLICAPTAASASTSFRPTRN